MNKSANPPKLTPTSYALLGLLARSPQSAYELNSLMQNSLIRVYWPRVNSHVYSEPKKLLRRGLVSEQKGKHNGRNRTVYTITPKGCEALTVWLADDAEVDLRMQAEFMLKLLLADSGTVANVHNTLQKSLDSSEHDLFTAIAGIKRIFEGEHPRDGAPYNGIAINLMADILIARYRWGKYALETSLNVNVETSVEDKVKLGKSAYRNALKKMEGALTE